MNILGISAHYHDSAAALIYRRIRVTLIQFIVSEEGRNIQAQQSVPGVLRPEGRDSRSSNLSRKMATRELAGPRQFGHNLRLIAALSREIGAEIVICRQARLESGSGTSGQSVEDYSLRNTRLSLNEHERAFAANNQVIESLAAEQGLEVVDMHSALRSEARFFHDGIHFSPEGSHAVSVFVADALEDNLHELESVEKNITEKSSFESL